MHISAFRQECIKTEPRPPTPTDESVLGDDSAVLGVAAKPPTHQCSRAPDSFAILVAEMTPEQYTRQMAIARRAQTSSRGQLHDRKLDGSNAGSCAGARASRMRILSDPISLTITAMCNYTKQR